MAANEGEVCNIALSHCGHREQLQSLNESSLAARLCKVHFPTARDSVLERLPWRFATARATLAAIANGERDGWSYAYTLPANCLKERRIWNGSRWAVAGSEIPYAIEHDAAAGRVLLTDVSPASLQFTFRVTNVALWPALFVDAVAWHLATKLALGLTVKPEVSRGFRDAYRLALLEAGASELGREQLDVAPEAEHIRVR